MHMGVVMVANGRLVTRLISIDCRLIVGSRGDGGLSAVDGYWRHSPGGSVGFRVLVQF